MSLQVTHFKTPPSIPIFAHWDITSGCNFQCTFCLTSAGSPSPNEISTKEAFSIIDKLHDAGILFLRILGGEPFFRKDILEIFGYAAKKGLILSFSTNAALLNSAIISELYNIKNSILYLQVSLYGFDEESYKKTTGSDNNFLKTLNGLKFLTQKFQPTILIVITDENVHDLIKYINLAKTYDPEEIRLVPKVNMGRSTTNNRPSAWVTLIQNLKLFQKSCNKIRVQAKPLFSEYLHELTGISTFYQNCDAATNMLYIDSIGKTSPCPFIMHLPDHLKEVYNHLKIDTIRDKDFYEIWNNETFQKIREYYNPQLNLFQINTNCKFFKSGACKPCTLTPCNCISLIKSVEKHRSENGV